MASEGSVRNGYARLHSFSVVRKSSIQTTPKPGPSPLSAPRPPRKQLAISATSSLLLRQRGLRFENFCGTISFSICT
jgi:hypothetical protein